MNLQRYWHTLRHLKFVQMYGRILFRVFRPTPDLRPAPPLREHCGLSWVPFLSRPAQLVPHRRIRLLNEEASLDASDLWNSPARSHLWRYTLHYFHFLRDHAPASYDDLRVEMISRWLADNPPGSGCGWEPYPLSQRIVNWIQWHYAARPLPADAIQSLAVQARYLMQRIEWHLQGNHLLANAKALFFAGLFFQGNEADRWRQQGRRILRQQLPQQILADGGHVERSPMYHALILEDLLDLYNLCRHHDQIASFSWLPEIGLMLHWLRAFTHPDGEIALLNDAAFDIAPPYDMLRQYAMRLGIFVQSQAPETTDTFFAASTGYLRLTSGPAVVMCDVAPLGPDYLPAHGHADTLTFEFSLQRQRIFVDPGTSHYAIGADRQRERSTAAHNTVTIDGVNSSDVWSAFRVGRRARVHDVRCDEKNGLLCAAHDGYGFLPGHPVHRRQWRLMADQLEIEDTVDGTGTHGIIVSFLCHPDVTPTRTSAGCIRLAVGNGMLDATLHMDEQLHIYIEPAVFSPAFGERIITQRIVGSLEGELPVRFLHRITWPNPNEATIPCKSSS